MTAALLLLVLGAPAEVQVEWKHEPQPRVIVDQKVWRCEADRCTGALPDKPFLKLRACRAIARYAGRVTAFSTPSGALDADALARCNGERR